MTYAGWEPQIDRYSEDDIRFYREIDRRFFSASDHFSRADAGAPPFSRLFSADSMQGKRVLEIGCGQGSHAELLVRAGALYTGIDITEVAVRRTTKRLALGGLTANVLRIDAEKMDFSDESFDLVWSWGVIHHSQDTQAIVDQIFRVLTPGGVAKVMVYHKNSLRYYGQGALRQGVLRGELLRRSLYEINKRFTDGAIAHHYTAREFRRMFGRFSRTATSVMDGEREAYIPLLGAPARRLAPRLMSRVDALLQCRFGWFLYLEATK